MENKIIQDQHQDQQERYTRADFLGILSSQTYLLNKSTPKYSGLRNILNDVLDIEELMVGTREFMSNHSRRKMVRKGFL